MTLLASLWGVPQSSPCYIGRQRQRRKQDLNPRIWPVLITTLCCRQRNRDAEPTPARPRLAAGMNSAPDGHGLETKLGTHRSSHSTGTGVGGHSCPHVAISAALAEEKQKSKGPWSPRSQTGAPGPTLLLGREFPDVAKHRPGVQR